MRLHRFGVAILVLLAVLPGCTRNGALAPAWDEDSLIEGDGTVRLTPIEVDCWLIAPDAGGQLEPINLPPDFEQDGLRVHFKAQPARSVLSTCQMAPIVRLIAIDRL